MPSSPDVETAESAPPGPSAHATERSGVWYPKGFWRRFSVPGIPVDPPPLRPAVLRHRVRGVRYHRSHLPYPTPCVPAVVVELLPAGTTLGKIFGPFLPTYVHTFMYVAIASALCLLIGYPVSYYVARFGGRWRDAHPRPADRAVLDQLPDAHARVAEPAHRRRLRERAPVPRTSARRSAGCKDRPVTVILGLVYGYIPYMILPLYGFLDRIDPRSSRPGATSEPARSRRSGGSRCRCRATRSRRAGDRDAADVRRLLHEQHAVELAQDEHDRQPHRRLRRAPSGQGPRQPCSPSS